jgi:hypothetical protein
MWPDMPVKLYDEDVGSQWVLQTPLLQIETIGDYAAMQHSFSGKW